MTRMQNRTAWLRAFEEWCRKHPEQKPPNLTITYADLLYRFANSDGTITYGKLAQRIQEQRGWMPETTRKHLRWFKRNGWLVDTNHAHRGRAQDRSLALPPGLDVWVEPQHAEALPLGAISSRRKGGTEYPPSDRERGVRTDPPKPEKGGYVGTEKGGYVQTPPSSYKPSVNNHSDFAGSAALVVPEGQESSNPPDRNHRPRERTAPKDDRTMRAEHPEHRTQAEQIAYLARLEAAQKIYTDASELIIAAALAGMDTERAERAEAELATPSTLQPDSVGVSQPCG